MKPVHTVQHAVYMPGKDSHGAPVDLWADPVPVAVYGWALATSGGQDNFEQGRDQTTTLLDLLVPPGVTGGHRDQWTILGQLFEQDGDLDDYNHGPFGYTPGGRIRLKKVKG